MLFLIQIRPDGSAVQNWALGDKPLVVGRGDHADVHVEDDALSNSHFLIITQGADTFSIDLKSRNGTWVNGNRVVSHKLLPGEVIQAGQSFFCFTDCPPSTFSSLNVIAAMTAGGSPSVRAA